MIKFDMDGNVLNVDLEGNSSPACTVRVEDVITRLTHFGYVATAADRGVIEYTLLENVAYALNYINNTVFPDIANYKLIDKVCSEFLYYKKTAGS